MLLFKINSVVQLFPRAFEKWLMCAYGAKKCWIHRHTDNLRFTLTMGVINVQEKKHQELNKSEQGVVCELFHAWNSLRRYSDSERALSCTFTLLLSSWYCSTRAIYYTLSVLTQLHVTREDGLHCSCQSHWLKWDYLCEDPSSGLLRGLGKWLKWLRLLVYIG